MAGDAALAEASTQPPASASRAEAGAALQRVLRRGDGAQRCFAVQALGKYGHKASLDGLIEALRDEDEDVRLEAAAALAGLGEARAVPALIENLRDDPCGDVKLNAVTALGRLRAQEAVPLLRALVTGRGESVAWDETGDGWDDWLDIQVAAIEALADLGIEEAAGDILAALKDEAGQDLGAVATRAFARLGSAGLDALVDCLETEKPRLRRQAAWALAAVGSDLAAERLAGHLRDPDSEVRQAVLRSLAAQSSDDARLADFCRDESPAVRADWVHTCGSRHPAHLDRLLDDPADAVQIAVLSQLRGLTAEARPPRLTERLRVKLRGPSVEVAAAVAPLLCDLAPEVGAADLREQLADRSCPAALRSESARTLARIGDRDSAAALVAQADDAERQIRLDSLTALAAIIAKRRDGADAARTALLAALEGRLVAPPEIEEEPSGSEPTRAPEAGTPEPEAKSEPAPPLSTLEAILGAEHEALTRDAEAPEGLSPEDIRRLELAAARPTRKHAPLEPEIALHSDVRRFAARVAGDLAEPAIATALARLLDETDQELQCIAADSLARVAADLGSLPKEAEAACLAHLSDEDRQLRLALLRCLNWAEGEAASAALRPLTGDPDPFVRAAAFRSLEPRRVSEEVFDAGLADGNADVRVAAAEALARSDGPSAPRRLIDLVFGFDGFHRHDAARLLRRVDPNGARAALIAVLDDPARRRAWRFAIEALEELDAHP